jgi:ribonuclease J
MQIVIHKGTKEIGGTCIQLSTTNSTILLDLGMPLSKDSEFINYSEIKTDAVIISHPHQDHYGLINSIDSSIPVYIGEVGKHLINSTLMFFGKELHTNNFKSIKRDQAFQIGDFKITPYLVVSFSY